MISYVPHFFDVARFPLISAEDAHADGPFQPGPLNRAVL